MDDPHADVLFEAVHPSDIVEINGRRIQIRDTHPIAIHPLLERIDETAVIIVGSILPPLRIALVEFEWRIELILVGRVEPVISKWIRRCRVLTDLWLPSLGIGGLRRLDQSPEIPVEGRLRQTRVDRKSDPVVLGCSLEVAPVLTFPTEDMREEEMPLGEARMLVDQSLDTHRRLRNLALEKKRPRDPEMRRRVARKFL